jgi:hypothetical protein
VQSFTGWPNFISTAPGVAYAYLDDYRRNRRDIFAATDSLSEPSWKLAMPNDALGAAVGRCNESAGNRPTFGAGPYVALGPVRAVFVHAEGGLAVDHEHRVLGPNDIPIAAFTRPARPAKADCCSKATAITSPGLSFPAAAPAATQHGDIKSDRRSPVRWRR